MLRLTFTTRLVLTMMLVVTLVSSAILAITRRSVEDAWSRMFEGRFLSQIASLNSLQKVRLESIQARCTALAKSETVVRAFQSGKGDIPEETVNALLADARVVRDSIASFEQQNGKGRGPEGPPRTGGAAAREKNKGNPGTATRRTLTGGRPWEKETASSDLTPNAAAPASGQSGAKTGAENFARRRYRIGPPDFIDIALINPQGQVRGLRTTAESKSQVTWLEAHMLSGLPDTQMVGYLAADTPFHFRMPREVIITPVANPAGGEDLGALVVGVPMSTYGENALHDLSRPGKRGDLHTGIWIGDELFSLSIPKASREAVAAAVRKALEGDNEAPQEVKVEGVPHRLLFRSLNPGSPTPEAYQITLYSLESLNAEQARIRWMIFGIAGGALLLGLLLSWLLSRRLVLPVRALVAGTREIRAGHYHTRVHTGTRDELADLAASFNEMAEGLAQRERYRSLLIQVSDDDIARQLMETACLGGERREVTVLFCDIREFTATTSEMEPEGIINMLNEHMTALTETVHRHHGVVDKFVGDLIMAIFGAPKSYGDNAGNAAACALEMMARRSALNVSTEHPPLRIGIGLASGTSIAGCMGSENRLNYTVLGEPVNLASRLCSAAGPDEIIIDPATRGLLGRRAAAVAMPPLRLKGFPKPVEPFLLTDLGEGGRWVDESSPKSAEAAY